MKRQPGINARHTAHTHPCIGCRTPVVCDDRHLEPNHDGWPEVVCSAIVAGVTIYCDACADSDADANASEGGAR